MLTSSPLPPIARLPKEVHMNVLLLADDWLPLSQVSQCWRDLALGIPVLWSDILAGRSEEWVALCLARSRNCSLEVHFLSTITIPLLQPHDHRIEALLFEGIDDGDHQVLAQLLSRPLPSLVGLSVVSSSLWSEETNEIMKASEWFPRLRGLHMHGVTLPLVASTLPDLHTLMIREIKAPVLEDVVAMLKHCPSLQSLEVYDVDFPPPEAPLPRTALLQVRMFRVIGSQSAVERFNNAVWAPYTAGLHCGELIRPGDVEDPVQYQRADWILPLVRGVEVVRLTTTSSKMACAGWRLPGTHTPEFHFYKLKTAAYDWGNRLRDGLRDLPVIFRASRVTRLKIDSDMLDEDEATLALWKGMFRAFPHLECLFLRGAGLPLTPVMALIHADGVTDVNGAVLCPRLDTLSLGIALQGSAELFERVLVLLEQRHALGRQLKRLDMDLRPDAYGDPSCSHAARMRNLVGEFNFKDAGLEAVRRISRYNTHESLIPKAVPCHMHCFY